MSEEYKTLIALDVRPGDRLNRVSGEKITVARVTTDTVYDEAGHPWELTIPAWRILFRAPRDRGKLVKPQDDAPAGGYTPGPRQAIAERPVVPNWEAPSAPRDDTPKLWRDMTDAEKGALLLAHHEGKAIEYLSGGDWEVTSPTWYAGFAYRARHEPRVETVTIKWHGKDIMGNQITDDYRITFNLIDGKPGPASIKMEILE